VSESDPVIIELEAIEGKLDTLTDNLRYLPDIISEVQGRLLAISLGSNSLDTHTGIAVLETMSNSIDFTLGQLFSFRNELRQYKGQV
jgi:hypothetical protein